MKRNSILLIIRWIVGLLFIFSGLIKANDPLGLGYKMQEFFEAWHMAYLNDYALPLSLVMNVFEVLAGVAIIIGWRMKTFSWLLLLLIIFFAFLTGYATLSGKFKSCGCFGDCLPLTPLQSFIKDLILLALIIILFINRNRIEQAFRIQRLSFFIIFFTVVGVALFESYVLAYLPLLDCLPYRKGNNIIEQMKVPAGAVSDSFALTFKYKKNGKETEFDQDHFPADFDSTYEYIDRYDKLVRQGTATAPITDFALQTLSGIDTTMSILNQPKYVLVMVQNFDRWKKQADEFAVVNNYCKAHQVPIFIVTPTPQQAEQAVPQANILRCDATVLKTAARVNATYFVMQKATIKKKVSYASKDKVVKYLERKTE